MPPIEAIVYVSSAVRAMSEPDLEALLETSRRLNGRDRITGALIYHEGSFLQYFEGGPAEVADLFRRIRASPLHRGIIELMHGPVAKRCFASWSMGLMTVPQSTMLRLSNANWVSDVSGLSPEALATDGLSLLLDVQRNLATGGRW